MDIFLQIELDDLKKETKDNNVSTFEQVQEYLSVIPYINYGGCGVSALAMYRWLKKNNQLKHTKFVYLYCKNSEDTYIKNQQVLKDELNNPLAPSHIVLLHNDKEIDVEFESTTVYYFKHIVEEERFVVKTVNTLESWNPDFNRKVYVRLIEKKLGIDLSDIISNEKQIDNYYQKKYQEKYNKYL